MARIASIEVLLLAGLGATIAAFYSGDGASPRSAESPLRLMEYVSIFIQASIYASIFLALVRTGRSSGSARAVRIAAQAFAAANAIIPLAYLFSAALRGGIPPVFGLGATGFVLTGAAVALAGVAFLLAELKEEPPSVRFLARGFGWSCLGFIPLTLLEAYLEASNAWPYKPVSVDSIFYLVLNCVSCVALARSLLRDEGRAFSGVDDERALGLGLTERERAMAELIGRGLSNKEIASELGISPATVRTHIYNLYRKVGAGSRVELLNRLAGR